MHKISGEVYGEEINWGSNWWWSDRTTYHHSPCSVVWSWRNSSQLHLDQALSSSSSPVSWGKHINVNKNNPLLIIMIPCVNTTEFQTKRSVKSFLKYCKWNTSWKVTVLVAMTFCNPMDCSPPGSSDHGISQARILKWVASPFSRGSSWSRDRTWVSCIAESLPSKPSGKPLKEITLY